MRSIIRKPSIRKSVSSRTTARVTRTVRKLSNPTYGMKGTGYIKDPGKAVYNKIYNKTSYGVRDLMQTGSSSSHGAGSSRYQSQSETHIVTNNNIADYAQNHQYVITALRKQGIKKMFLGIFLLIVALPCILSVTSPFLFFLGFALFCCSIYQLYKSKQFRTAYKDAKAYQRNLHSSNTDEFIRKLRS